MKLQQATDVQIRLHKSCSSFSLISILFYFLILFDKSLALSYFRLKLEFLSSSSESEEIADLKIG